MSNINIPESSEDNPTHDREQYREEKKNDQPKSDDSGEKRARFKEGQTLQFVRVRFPGNSRSFPFLVGKRKFVYGQKVVAMSDRGMAVGYINSFPYDVSYQEELEYKTFSKILFI